MLMKIRLIGKFVLWMLEGLVSRIAGRKSFVGWYWEKTKAAIRYFELELFLYCVVGPTLTVVFTFGICAACDVSIDATKQAMRVAFVSNVVWMTAAFISVLWDRFMWQYEETFRTLKEKHDV
jgi:hypothetical protein